MSDGDTGYVLHVSSGRNGDGLASFFASMTPEERAAVRSVSMDMWQPYYKTTLEWIPDAKGKLCFDRFHVAKKAGDMVKQVLRAENKELAALGNFQLKGTRYAWLMSYDKMGLEKQQWFDELRSACNKSSVAWSYKQQLAAIWTRQDRRTAEWKLRRWIAGASRCGLSQVKRLAKMVKKHMWGIINAMPLGVTNSMAESVNSKIKAIKIRSYGFRNKDRFKNAILFQLGNLDLHPEGTSEHIPPTQIS